MGRNILTIAIVLAVGPSILAQDVIITEVMASSDDLFDEDGQTSDWFEIFNAGGEAVNLAGWYATDDSEDLTKWEFPEVDLAVGQFLLVFASGKDRRNSERQLHTSFKLSSEGEYLAIVQPDGVTITSELSPEFPQQKTDVSYGAWMEVEESILVAPETMFRYVVPESDGLGMTWIEADFDDSSWTEASRGIGYDRSSRQLLAEAISTNVEEEMYRVSSSMYVRIPFEIAGQPNFNILILKMKYDDGFIAYINGVEVARDNVRDHGDPLSWASRAASNRTADEALAAVEIHVGGSSSFLREGRNVLAIHGLNSQSRNSDFFQMAEMSAGVIVGLGRDSGTYFEEATPGIPNSIGLSGLAKEPTFSHPSATFVEDFNLELAVDDPAAVIRYTLTGDEPTEASAAYLGPIPITQSTTVTTKSFKEGAVSSSAVKLSYLKIASSLVDFDSNLPIMMLSADGAPTGETFVDANLVLLQNADGRTGIVDTPQYVGQAALKRRGSSSGGWPKGNYALEIRDTRGNDEDVELFGMPADSDWVLHGPYSDKSLMRNALTYEWSNAIGRYAPRTRFCEVFFTPVSGSTFSMGSSYVGVYAIIEKIKRGEHRVNIASLYPSQSTEPEITGGYLLKKDRKDPGDSGFPVPSGRGFESQTLLYVGPKEHGPGSASLKQKIWLKDWMGNFAGALASEDFADPENGYAKYIDVGSFIDHHILVELCKNIDGFRLSTFMFKDRGGKLNMGPVWDYNLSLRNADYLEGWTPVGWYYALISRGDYPWYARLFMDTDGFKAKYIDRWITLRSTHFRRATLLASIDQNVQLLSEAAERNFEKWRTLGRYLWPNPNPLARTWDQEVELMVHWLEGRLRWMDSELIPGPVITPRGGEIGDGVTVTIDGPEGLVYYTRDGSNPLSAKGLSENAVLYDGPFTVTENTIVSARILPDVFGGGPMASEAFVSGVPKLVITEIHFDPIEDEQSSGTNLEFVEIFNADDKPISLRGIRFTAGVNFDFEDSVIESLNPGEYAVVVRNQEAFERRYGADVPVAGEFSGSLSNRGEDVSLAGPVGKDIAEFPYVIVDYKSSWLPGGTDGHSLVLDDSTTPREEMSDPSRWRQSKDVHGSPGEADGGLAGEGPFIRGDCDNNGVVGGSPTEAIVLLNFSFRGGDEPACLAACDAESNGSIGITDALRILRHSFLGLGQPDPPFPDCAKSDLPSDLELGCATPFPCE